MSCAPRGYTAARAEAAGSARDRRVPGQAEPVRDRHRAQDGTPHTAATWYLWENGRVLVNMDEGRKRLGHLRANPRVSITVLGDGDWYHQVTLRGQATLEDDPQLEAIDRIARHYTGEAYPTRDRGRVSAWIDVESWYGWAQSRFWTGSD